MPKPVRRSARIAGMVEAKSTFDWKAALEVLENGSRDEIHNAFESVCHYLDGDEDRIGEIFLGQYGSFLVFEKNWRHQYLLRCVFETCGLKNPDVKRFLNMVPDGPLLSYMGVNRVRSANNNIHYRIRTGISIMS